VIAWIVCFVSCAAASWDVAMEYVPEDDSDDEEEGGEGGEAGKEEEEGAAE
jgi:hypothetical protein